MNTQFSFYASAMRHPVALSFWSAKHQYRHVAHAQQGAGRATGDQLSNPGMTKGTHNQQIRAMLLHKGG
jgi:hypothetical protein